MIITVYDLDECGISDVDGLFKLVVLVEAVLLFQSVQQVVLSNCDLLNRKVRGNLDDFYSV